MNLGCRIKHKPEIDFDKIDSTRMLTAIATDVAVVLQKRIRQGDIKPKLKASTIERKKETGSRGDASTPLLHTGLLMDSIKGKKAGHNRAIVHIEEKVYGQQKHKGFTKKGKSSWHKTARGKTTIAKKTKSGKYSKLPTTNEVANIHEKGLGQKKRRFFGINQKQLDKIVSNHVKRGWPVACKKAGIIK